MTTDRIDRILRRAADDVHATVVRPAVPPSVDHIDRNTPRWTVAAVSLLLLAGSIAGIALIEHHDASAPAAQPVPTEPHVELPAAPGDLTSDPACRSVVEIATSLGDAASSVDAWAQLTPRLDELEAQLQDVDRSDTQRRRYDRFLVLARNAVELGTAGGFTPAQIRADDAEVVARDLVDFVDEATCSFDEAVERRGR